MRQCDRVPDYRQAAAVDLRVTGSMRGPVVEQYDPLSQRHRASRPRDDRRAHCCGDVEQVQCVGEHSYVAPGDHHSRRAAERRRYLGSVPGDHRPVMRLQVLVELAAQLTGAPQVRGVEIAYRFDGHGRRASCQAPRRRSRAPASRR